MKIKSEEVLDLEAKFRGATQACIRLKDEMKQLENIIEAQNKRIQELEKALLIIGDRAVVDWDDLVVGQVDDVVPRDRTIKYKDFLREIFKVYYDREKK